MLNVNPTFAINSTHSRKHNVMRKQLTKFTRSLLHQTRIIKDIKDSSQQCFRTSISWNRKPPRLNSLNKNPSSNKFSEKIWKFRNHQFFGKIGKFPLTTFLFHLGGHIFENFHQNILTECNLKIWGNFQKSDNLSDFLCH